MIDLIWSFIQKLWILICSFFKSYTFWNRSVNPYGIKYIQYQGHGSQDNWEHENMTDIFNLDHFLTLKMCLTLLLLVTDSTGNVKTMANHQRIYNSNMMKQLRVFPELIKVLRLYTGWWEKSRSFCLHNIFYLDFFKEHRKRRRFETRLCLFQASKNNAWVRQSKRYIKLLIY